MPDLSPKVLVAVLAAGASRRLGRSKQLVEISGEPMVRRQCRIAVEANVGNVVAILGCGARDCVTALGSLTGASVRLNEGWEEGLASSIRQAVHAAIDADASGLMLVHGDQYALTVDDLRLLHSAWLGAGGMKACRSRHEDYLGPPVILPARCFDAALALRGDDGARDVIRGLGREGSVEVPMPNAVRDLDEPRDLARPLACSQEHGRDARATPSSSTSRS
jgi:CTP:molybdopterin cytidylyltransferase MocA